MFSWVARVWNELNIVLEHKKKDDLKSSIGIPPTPSPPQERDEKVDNFNKVLSGTCPYCGSVGRLYEGPEAGMSINIYCSVCQVTINVTPIIHRAEMVRGPSAEFKRLKDGK